MNFLLLLLCALACQAQPKQFTARVIGVSDGDTYKVLYGQTPIKVRLNHVDCPEKGQPFGKAAKKFGSDFCFGKTLTVRSHGKRDRYGRLIGEIYIGNKCLNKELVRNGLAWHFARYSKDREYAGLNAKARIGRVGLWRDAAAVPPWQWRKQKRNDVRAKVADD